MGVTFEVNTPAQLEELKELWKSMDVQIGSVGNAEKTFILDYIVVGDLTGSIVDAILEDAGRAVDLVSVDVGFSYGADNGSRSVRITAEVRSRGDVDALDAFFTSMCRDRGMVLVRGGIM